MTYTRALEGVIILSCNMTHTAEHGILKTYIWKNRKVLLKPECLSVYMYSYRCLCILIVVYVFLDAAILTEVFVWFFLGCKANSRV